MTVAVVVVGMLCLVLLYDEIWNIAYQCPRCRGPRRHAPDCPNRK